MGKLRSGILGNIRGKVAGVVGSQWKDVNYVREYVKPANPQTVAQQAQRSKMALTVAFIKPLVGTVLNAYSDPFQKSMSGFNRFIKTNISLFEPGIDYTDVSLVAGKLQGSEIGTIDSASGGQSYTVHWSDSNGNNGKASDKVCLVCRNNVTGRWYQAIDGAIRSDGSLTIFTPGVGAGNSLTFYLLFSQYSGTKLQLVSASTAKNHTGV